MSCGTCGESRHSKGCEHCAHGTVVCGGCGTEYLIPVAPPVVEQAVDFDGNPEQDFVVLSRRKVRIERADLCADCQRKYDLIVGGIIFGIDYPCSECRDRIVARSMPPSRSRRSAFDEADIVINGVRLDHAQSMAVRVAVTDFLHDLANTECHAELEGQTRMEALGCIGPLYQKRMSEVQDLIMDLSSLRAR